MITVSEGFTVQLHCSKMETAFTEGSELITMETLFNQDNIHPAVFRADHRLSEMGHFNPLSLI